MKSLEVKKICYDTIKFFGGICGKKSNRKDSKQRYQITVHDESEFKCDLCDSS